MRVLDCPGAALRSWVPPFPFRQHSGIWFLTFFNWFRIVGNKNCDSFCPPSHLALEWACVSDCQHKHLKKIAFSYISFCLIKWYWSATGKTRQGHCLLYTPFKQHNMEQRQFKMLYRSHKNAVKLWKANGKSKYNCKKNFRRQINRTKTLAGNKSAKQSLLNFSTKWAAAQHWKKDVSNILEIQYTSYTLNTIQYNTLCT